MRRVLSGSPLDRPSVSPPHLTSPPLPANSIKASKDTLFISIGFIFFFQIGSDGAVGYLLVVL